MSCCMHAIEERQRADRSERQRVDECARAIDAVVKLQARNAELEAALRPFGDAYRFTLQMGSMRREYEASMTCTGKFTVQDLARAAELTNKE